MISSRPEFVDRTVTGRPGCRPFGVTWNEKELFIANNKQVLVFDKQLEFVRRARTQLQVNSHQLGYKTDECGQSARGQTR